MTTRELTAPVSLDRGILVKLYEELRSWIVHPSRGLRKGPGRLGWGVLVSRGMREWMAICSSLSGEIDHDVDPSVNEASFVSESSRRQMVAAIAGVLTSHIEREGQHES